MYNKKEINMIKYRGGIIKIYKNEFKIYVNEQLLYAKKDSENNLEDEAKKYINNRLRFYGKKSLED